MLFFKDQKASKTMPEQTFRGELPLILEGASVDVASDYKKRKHVFRIKWVLINSHIKSQLYTQLHSKRSILMFEFIPFFLHTQIDSVMAANFYSKHTTMLNYSNGWAHSGHNVKQHRVVKVDHRHCPHHHNSKRMKTKRNHSLRWRKSK